MSAAPGCNEEPGAEVDGSTESATDTEGPTTISDEPATNSDELFSIDRLPRFDIYIDEASWAALEAEPKEWTAGTFEYAGKVYAPVGVRLKGNHSFRPLDEKPAFKIKFNKYTPGARFLGLEGITLNNMVVDSSMLHEWISYRLFRELDVPAPRAGYAQVFVNGEEYGLYLTLEPYDDEFLERVHDDPSGNLYESDKGGDLDEPVDSWEQDEGDDLSREDLTVFSELALMDGTAVFYGDQGLVDMPRFLAFLAGEAIIGHFDGHMGGHNFFIYHEPTLDLWSYQPWSLDQTLLSHANPYNHFGYLGYKCLHENECLIDYIQASQAALTKLEAIDFEDEVAQVISLTDAAMLSDPRRPYTVDRVESGREHSLGFITGRADELAPQFDCLVDGEEPDADNDGYGPCFQDCNEADPGVNPDAVEACDGVDNDCTGYADDDPACECPSIQSEGRTFYMCLNSITWNAARSFCIAQDHTLAQFDSPGQMATVWAAASEIHSGRWSIGLDDRTVEEDYRWQDDTQPSFTAWADGEPSHQLDWFDCVFMQGGVWVERNCISKGAFICSDPL